MSCDLEQLWSGLSLLATEHHAVAFKTFCVWLSGCDHRLQQQMLSCCTSAPDSSAHSDFLDLPAAYCIAKPHILSLQERGAKGCVLNLEHFNLGPHELAAWAPVFSSSEITEIRLSHNRIAHCIGSTLPAIAGRFLGGIGDGVVKLYAPAAIFTPQTKPNTCFV